jgi:integrase
MASIRERVDKDGVKTFHVQIRIRGFPPQTKTFTKKTIAKQWADDVELKIRSGRYLPTAMAEKRLARDLIQRYRTSILPYKKEKQRKDSARHLDWWDKRVGKFGVLELTSDLIGRCRDELLVTPTRTGTMPAPASVVKRMSVFSHVLATAVKEWQWLPESPMARVAKPKVKNNRVRFLSEVELASLLTATATSESPELHTIVAMAIATGMRYGEIMNLHWSDVSFQQGDSAAFVVLRETKNGTQRGVPISAFALEQVKAWRTRAMTGDKMPYPESLLFPSSKDTSRPTSIRTAWRTALRKSKIQKFRFHDLRHTAASYLAMSGATASDISEILGHKDLQMVKRYAHLSKEHITGVLTRMGDIHLPAAKEIKPAE